MKDSKYWKRVIGKLDYLDNFIRGDYPVCVLEDKTAPISRCEFDKIKDFEDAVIQFHDTFDVILGVIGACKDSARYKYKEALIKEGNDE